MSPQPPRPSPAKGLLLLLIALPLGLTAWYLIAEGNAVAHTIEWWCVGGECSTDDSRVFLVIGGVAANIACFAVLVPVLRLVAFGTALALGPLAAMQGWRTAIDSGLAASEVDAEFRFWGIAAALGLALAFAGLVYELRATAALEVLFGRERVPAELAEYREGPKSGIGAAVLVFRDRAGHPHRRPCPAVPEGWTRRPLLAVYPPRDPSRARIALPWYRPLTAEQLQALVKDGDAEPAASFTDELERLASLRREGLLSEAEYEQAKRRLLES